MLAATGFVFVAIALVRALRQRLLWTASAALFVGIGHTLAFLSSFHALRASGNPVAVLGLLVLGRTALAEDAPVTSVAASFARYPLVANALFVVASGVAFASLDHRLKQVHPETPEAQRIAALTNALLAVALVDGLLLGIGLLARALLRDDG